jgi:hypothetical protein
LPWSPGAVVDGSRNLRWVFPADHLGCVKQMSDFAYMILAGFIFGTIGMGAFAYGRKLELWQPRAIGVALMVYPYLFTNLWLLWGVGTGLLVLLYYFHSE